MNSNTKGLIQACKNLGLEHSCHHGSQNFFSVKKNGLTHFFCNWKTPLNPESTARICRDKDYCFQLTKDFIKNPETIAFLSPFIEENFMGDATQLIKKMADTACEKLDLPFIIKSNAQSMGTNVFFCHSKKEIENALSQIFNVDCRYYDYVALAQEYIAIQKEYRAIFLNGKLEFAYEKSSPPAKENENLSPLHRSGSKAILIECTQELEAISNFCQTLFENIPIPYCGLDIALDRANQHYLIEINSSPSFDYFERDNGDKKIVSLYENILESL